MIRNSRSVNASVACRFAAALLSVVVFASCTDTAKPLPDSVRSDALGGTLVIALPRDAKWLYPPKVDQTLDFAIIGSIYDKLADIGDALNTTGDAGFEHRLAESWKWASDSLSIGFKIRADAKFHDGVPVRAEDVRFTFRAYTDTRGQTVNESYLSNIDSVSIPDSLTAVFWFKRRTPQQFFDATYQMFILPSHLLADIPIEELGTDSVTANPVGSGRFRYSGRVPQQSIEMISDTGNYRKRAKVDRVVWAVNANVQGAALSVFSGDADFFEKLQPDDLDKVPKNPDLKIVPYMQAGYSYLGFNLRSPQDHTKPNPLFSDVRVRRALTMAVDRVASARSVLDTFARPAIGPAPRMMFPNPDSLTQIPFDVVHARALLDTAGWILEPGKDVRTKNGVPLAFEIVMPNTSRPRIAYADLLVQQFRGVGAAATSRAIEGQVWYQMMLDHKFDATLGAWNVTPGMRGLPQTWGSRGMTGQNYQTYSRAAFDADVDAALGSMVPATAGRLWNRAFQQIIDDAPSIFLYEERAIGLMQKRVNPARMRADAWYSDLADWTIDANKRLPRDRQSPGAAR
ncbi:MAG: peptide ABC transporter substrate-binding protein [Gemmatimonadaceae bacterium]